MLEIFIWNCCDHFIVFVLFMLLQRIFVAIMVYVPFMIWKSVDQNIFCHSSHILTTLLTSGFSFSICNLKRIGRMMKQCQMHSSHNMTALPTSGHNIYLFLIWKCMFHFWFQNLYTKIFDCTPHLWVQYLFLTFENSSNQGWCCADYGLCSIFYLKIWTPKYLLALLGFTEGVLLWRTTPLTPLSTQNLKAMGLWVFILI